jgi:hypothetical protein
LQKDFKTERKRLLEGCARKQFGVKILSERIAAAQNSVHPSVSPFL